MSDEPLSIRHYWGEILAAAWKDTDLLSWSKTLTTLGISGLGFLLQWAIGVRAFYLTVQIIGTVIAAYVVVALISFAGNLIRVPADRDRERGQEIDSLTVEFGKRLSQEEIIDQLTQFLDEGHEQLKRCKHEYSRELQLEADRWTAKVAEYLEKGAGKAVWK